MKSIEWNENNSTHIQNEYETKNGTFEQKKVQSETENVEKTKRNQFYLRFIFDFKSRVEEYYTQRKRCQLTRWRVDQHSSSVRSLIAAAAALFGLDNGNWTFNQCNYNVRWVVIPIGSLIIFIFFSISCLHIRDYLIYFMFLSWFDRFAANRNVNIKKEREKKNVVVCDQFCRMCFYRNKNESECILEKNQMKLINEQQCKNYWK